MSRHVQLGPVTGPDGDVDACLHPDGSVTLYDAGGAVTVPAGSLRAVAELLDRAAMPGVIG